MKFEAEVVSMTANFVNGNDSGVTGSLSSGGTESIFLSLKTHRSWARATKNIYHPEVICPITAHAAFDKACEILNMTLIHVDGEMKFCSRCVVPPPYVKKTFSIF
jgi:sphinganine-1-phosphate aldolase